VRKRGARKPLRAVLNALAREFSDSMATVKEKLIESQAHGRGEEIDNRLPGKRLFTLKESALYLGRGLYGVRELIWKGKLPVVRDGRKMWIDREDLDQYIEACKGSYFLREADERNVKQR
jgi:excisionase family DNA binding protein